MIGTGHVQLVEIEQRVCDIASTKLGFAREMLSPASRMLEDLHCDSLELFEFFMEIEDAFDVTLSHREPNPIFKAVFTRQPFRLSDLAELVYLQQGTGTPDRVDGDKHALLRRQAIRSLFRNSTACGANVPPSPRNFSSRCPSTARLHNTATFGWDALRPDSSASVEIGSAGPDAPADERPLHVVRMDSYLIDAEPVSTTAYCRFLNTIGPVDPEVLAEWFLLNPQDDRNGHVLIERRHTNADQWQEPSGGR